MVFFLAFSEMSVEPTQSNDYDVDITTSLTQESVDYALASLKSSGTSEVLRLSFSKTNTLRNVTLEFCLFRFQLSSSFSFSSYCISGAFEKLVADYRKKLESDRDFMLDFDATCREVMQEKGISDLRIEHLLEKADALEKLSGNHTQRVEETTQQVSTALREVEATLTKKTMDALYDDINNLESNLTFN